RRAPLDARRGAALAQLLELRLSILARELRRLLPLQQRRDLVLHLIELALRGGLVLEHARRDQRTGRDLDRVGVALVVQRIGGEQRREELAVVERPALLAAGAGEPAARLDLELEALGRGLQAVGLLVDHVLERVGGLAEAALGAALLELGLDLLAHRLERLRVGRRGDEDVARAAFLLAVLLAHPGELDDVEAEL